MLEKSMVTAIRSFWLIQERQFVNAILVAGRSMPACGCNSL